MSERRLHSKSFHCRSVAFRIILGLARECSERWYGRYCNGRTAAMGFLTGAPYRARAIRASAQIACTISLAGMAREREALCPAHA
jgi:hypothetical protein